jgi:DNA-binding MarR family transcriptional regulator
MSMPDDAIEARAQGWRTLAALHSRIEERVAKVLTAEHEISVSEYTVLDVLTRQDEHHMRMAQLSNAVVLSQSATTRLVTRLEARGFLRRCICEDDRRGIYTELTAKGHELLESVRPTHDQALADTLAEAAELPELAPLVEALEGLGAVPTAG